MSASTIPDVPFRCSDRLELLVGLDDAYDAVEHRSDTVESVMPRSGPKWAA